jgi:Fic family protein
MQNEDRTVDETNARTYLGTHPWIKFRLDLQKSPFSLWVDLGAIQSKIEHVAYALLPPRIAQKLHSLYLAKGAHATTAIEGNTLSEEQVQAIVNEGKSLPKSQAYLKQEIDNIVEACNLIGKEVLQEKETRLFPDRIKTFNKMVLKDLPVEAHVIPGVLRNYSVGVANYRGAPHEDCEFLLGRLCQWLQELASPKPEFETGFAVLRAIMAHLYIAWIHPFGDGNGRTARLIEFQTLISGGVPTIAAHLLSNFYNKTRTEYYRQLTAASESGGNVMPFLCYALGGFKDSLDEQIEEIRSFQWEVTWRDYVYYKFRDLKGDASRRRRTLALMLKKATPPEVPLDEVKHLTPEIAEFYAKRTAKTLMRDINELEKMELLIRSAKSVQANFKLLTQFLPGRRKG